MNRDHSLGIITLPWLLDISQHLLAQHASHKCASSVFKAQQTFGNQYISCRYDSNLSVYSCIFC